MDPAFYFAKRLMVAAGCLMLMAAFSGCSTLRVHQMQRRADQGDDAWIIAQTIDCDTPSPGMRPTAPDQGQGLFAPGRARHKTGHPLWLCIG